MIFHCFGHWKIPPEQKVSTLCDSSRLLTRVLIRQAGRAGFVLERGFDSLQAGHLAGLYLALLESTMGPLNVAVLNCPCRGPLSKMVYYLGLLAELSLPARRHLI